MRFMVLLKADATTETGVMPSEELLGDGNVAPAKPIAEAAADLRAPARWERANGWL